MNIEPMPNDPDFPINDELEKLVRLSKPHPVDSATEMFDDSEFLKRVSDIGYIRRIANQQPLPKTIGAYEIIELIGSGGMGVVYKARHSGLDRLVALKLIRSGRFANEQQVDRFRAETTALGKLDHPGIVPVFDVGQADEQYFFSMAFVTGENLNEQIKTHGPLPPRKAASLIKRVAEAIHHAHSRGVVHRDIKPHNILVDAENGMPRITDFGLAKHMGGDSELTATGQVMGTPSYMSPEQAAGIRADVNEKSDIYSLGATLYFLLVARPPFQAASPIETIRQVLGQSPPRLGVLNSNVPMDLETICLKCLNKEPARRYSNAGELAKDLTRWMNNEPILARPVSLFEKSWKWCKKRPALIGTIVVSVLALVGVSVFFVEARNDAEASRLVEGLLQADKSQVGSIIDSLSGYQSWAKDDLVFAFEESPEDSNAKLHAALALISIDDSVLPFLKERLLSVPPTQFESTLVLLDDYKTELTPYYWQVANDESQDNTNARFHAACAVARFDSTNESWNNQNFAQFVVSYLVNAQPSELLPWRNTLRPVKDRLEPSLLRIYADVQAGDQVRSFATYTLVDYLSDDVQGLFGLLVIANEQQFPLVYDKLSLHRQGAIELGNAEIVKVLVKEAKEDSRQALARSQANAAVMLLRLGASEQVWTLLRHSSDQRIRSRIIHWLSERGGAPQVAIDRLDVETDVSIRRALLLCLGEFDVSQISEVDRKKLIEKVLEIYRRAPDSGLHGAAEWLLRKWGQVQAISAVDDGLRQSEEQLLVRSGNDRKWYINTQGQTFSVLDCKGAFQMGSPESETDHATDEVLHLRRIGRRIAISTKEVTREQWRKFATAIGGKVFRANKNDTHKLMPTGDSAMITLSWYQAAWYCNWLSEKEGIPKEQWCFEKNEQGEYGPGMKAKRDFLKLDGYRFPTEAEWEFACRAGTGTSRCFGTGDALLPEYAWYQANAKVHSNPVARLKPNDFGIFDMHGNVYEWCYDEFKDYPPIVGDFVVDLPDSKPVMATAQRVLRSCSFFDLQRFARSATRYGNQPGEEIDDIGFRPARTIR